MKCTKFAMKYAVNADSVLAQTHDLQIGGYWYFQYILRVNLLVCDAVWNMIHESHTGAYANGDLPVSEKTYPDYSKPIM